MTEQARPGDAGRITREYLDSLLLEMRHIDNVAPSTAFELYGQSFETPVMLAALSHLNNVHPEGLIEAARGVRAAGAVMWCGMGEPAELEGILRTGAKTIKIIKPYADNRDILNRIAHAEEHGALAVGMDIDHQFGSLGSWGQVLGLPMAPKTMEEIRSFVKATKLPFIIKGVLSELDAQKCVDAGVRGMVVSHHHGMVDYALPPLQILPRIAKVVAGTMPIFVDCDINTGLDAFKAIALGATAVSVGRAVMGPLGKEGAAGVEQKIRAMTEALHWAMAVTHAADLRGIDASVIWQKGAQGPMLAGL